MKTLFTIFLFLFFAMESVAQASTSIIVNTITTAVPFLMIAPDARAGGMGETGVATSPDVNSMHWSPAKLAFANKKFGVGIAYTPYLRSLVPDVNHSYISYYSKLDSNSTIGSSFRYFSMGNITYTNNTGGVIGQYRPYEYAFDICYARRFAKYWSGGIAARYIFSNLAGQITPGYHDGKSVAADLSIYYFDKERVKYFGKKSTMMLGLAITNIGSKISYSNSGRSDFIPTNLRLGQGLIIQFDSKNQLAFQYEFNKLLVPSPPRYELDSSGSPKINPSTGQYIILAGKDPNRSVISGMIGSFNDAPGGKQEEIDEINFSGGMEYWYDKTFALRIGYFYEAPEKGNRQFITIGAGVKFNIATLDFAYMITTNGQRNPMQNMLRFSLLFEFDQFKKKK